MALAPCRECGQMVSSEATSCPACGVPNPTQTAAALEAANKEGEVYHAHVHAIVYSWALIFTLLFVLTLVITGEPPLLRWIAAGLAAIVWLASYIVAHSVEFVVTNKRVLTRSGILAKNSQETLLEKVETVGVHQDLLGRILGYGTVTVVGTGGSHDVFKRIARPLRLRQAIHDQIDVRKNSSVIGRA